MNNNIIQFYVLANKLKNVVRTGWKELKISRERLESVAEHVYGCMVLAIGIESEKALDLDLSKVFKMLILKELEKVNLKEVTTRDYLSEDERQKQRSEVVKNVTASLRKQEELLQILEEYNQQETPEAKFTLQLSKIEADLQAKIYDLDGNFDMEVAKEDVKYFGEELAEKILPQMKNASDGFLLYDRKYYTDELFKKLSEDIQNMSEI